MGRYTEALRKLEEERNKRRSDSGGPPLPRKIGLKAYAIGAASFAVVILGLVYAFGVHRGARFVETTLPQRIVLPEPPPPAEKPEPVSPVSQLAASGENALLLESVENMMKLSYETEEPVWNKQEFYTIQLVTYGNQDRAREEAGKLKKQGLDAFVVRSGTYFQVCLEKFADEAQATRRLFEIKSLLGSQTYSDAFVRFVKRKP